MMLRPMSNKDLDDVFKLIFKIDINNYPLHEIPETIAFYGICTWNDFTTSWSCDITILTKAINDHTRVRISPFNQVQLMIITDMISVYRAEQFDGWNLADTYTYSAFFQTAFGRIPLELLRNAESEAEALRCANAIDELRRDALLLFLKLAVRRRARLLCRCIGVAQNIWQAQVLNCAAILVQRMWRGFSQRVQFCKDIIDIICVQHILRQSLFCRLHKSGVEAELQCVERARLEALFHVWLDAILRQGEYVSEALSFSARAKESLTRIGILPVLLKLDSHLVGFPLAHSPPTGSPPAEPPPTESPPVEESVSDFPAAMRDSFLDTPQAFRHSDSTDDQVDRDQEHLLAYANDFPMNVLKHVLNQIPATVLMVSVKHESRSIECNLFRSILIYFVFVIMVFAHLGTTM